MQYRWWQLRAVAGLSQTKWSSSTLRNPLDIYSSPARNRKVRDAVHRWFVEELFSKLSQFVDYIPEVNKENLVAHLEGHLYYTGYG